MKSVAAPTGAGGGGEDAVHQSALGEEDGGPGHGTGAAAALGVGRGAWLCCMPCAWLRGHAGVHRASLTAATLLVTALLVASPVLFLISSKPGEKRLVCDSTDDDDCGSKSVDCTSRECHMIAARFKSVLNVNADPCTDFFKFACGGWTEPRAGAWDAGPHAARKWGLQWGGGHTPGAPASSTPASRHRPPDVPFVSVPSLQASIDKHIQVLLEGAISGPYQKLGEFYNSCLKAGDKRISTAPLFTLLDELGGYQPMNATPDITALLANLLTVNGAPFFNIYVDRDLTNRTRYGVYVDLPLRPRSFMRNPGSLPLRPLEPDFLQGGDTLHKELSRVARELRSKRDKQSTERPGKLNHSDAFTFIKKKFQERRLVRLEKLLQDFLPDDLRPDQRQNESHSVLLFVSRLSEALPRERDMLHHLQEIEAHSRLTIAKMNKDFSFVDWSALLTRLYNTTLPDDEPVYVLSPGYLDTLQKLVLRFPPSVVHNALLLVFATDTLLELVDVTASSDWAAMCGHVTVQVFAQPVAAMYLSQWSPRELAAIRTRVSALLELLRSTARRRLSTLPWLDQPTREAALRKLASLQGRYIAPAYLSNETYIQAILDEVEVDPDDFFGNVVRRYRKMRSDPIDLRSPPTSILWSYPFVANAFYDPTVNTIVVPLAVLAQPWIWGAAPRYMWLAGLGAMLAHEVLHGFDLNGVRFDETGEPRPWMTPESRLRLEARVHCLTRQYASTFSHSVKFLGHQVDVQFDWNLTRNENLADIGGLQLAWDAWRDLQEEHPDFTLPGIDLSPRQLFFVASAQNYCYKTSDEYYVTTVEVDIHTPYRERVNGMMMNAEGFADAFQCPPGSPLNTPNKCSVW